MSFQSLRLFRLVAELKGKAAALRKEALQHLTVALAGTDTKELFTLLVTFFGKGTDVDPFSFIDTAPIIKQLLDLTITESESEAGDDAASTSTTATTTTEPSTSTGASRRLRQRSRLKSSKKPLILTSVSTSRKLLGFYQKMQAPSTTPAFLSNSLSIVWGRMNMGLLSTPVPIRSVVIPLTLGIFLAVGAMSGVFISRNTIMWMVGAAT